MSQLARSINAYRVPDMGRRRPGRGSMLGIGIIAIPVLAIVFTAASLWEGFPWAHRVASLQAVRLALLGLALLFLGYAARRELRLRRLTDLLGDERVLSAAYANRVRDLQAMDEAARVIGSILELRDMLPALLDQTIAAFRASQGSIMLFDGAGYLETVAARGNEGAEGARLKIGDSVAGHVALTREPLLLSGEANPDRFERLVERKEAPESAMSVPLLTGDRVLGVLNLNAAPGRPFTEHDLQLLTLLARHAAIAVANARSFQSARDERAHLAAALGRTSEVIEEAARDLEAPVRALRSGLAALRRAQAADPDADDILDAMERSAERVASSAVRLRADAHVEHRSVVASVTCVLADIARQVAADFGAEGRPVAVAVSGSAEVSGDPGLIEQVLWALLDNAFVHGAPPVRLDVWTENDHGVVAVSDHGPGLTPDQRSDINDRSGPGGMGLGLSIAHGIVSSCNGSVWAETADGGGARFRVSLPLARQVEPQGREEMTA